MTRRERLERKLEKRREWGEDRKRDADRLSEESHKMMSVIPMGQPILIGHHSEKADRRYRDRAWNKMGKAVAMRDLAEHHNSKAAGLERALDNSIFSDDVDAIQELEIRIKNNETKRCHMVEVNRLYRKGDAASLAGLGLNLDELRAKLTAAGPYWGKAPYMPYELTNLGARIRDDKKRLEEVKKRQTRTALAENSKSGAALETLAGGYCRVTFAEKPAREILTALKAAGYYWHAGSWTGKQEQLPAPVRDFIDNETPIVWTEKDLDELKPSDPAPQDPDPTR